MKMIGRNRWNCMAAIMGITIVTAFLWPYTQAAGFEQKASSVKLPDNVRSATNSNGDKIDTDFFRATPSAVFRQTVNSLGDIWDQWSGKTSFEFLDGKHGDGSAEHPFMIRNREQLMGLSELTAMGMNVPDGNGVDYAGDYSGCAFALSNDIDLQGISWIPIGFYSDSSETAGSIEHGFCGTFNGNGHAIKNFKLNGYPTYNSVGLFGQITDSVISDVTVIPLTDSEIRGNDYVGVLVGSARDSAIRNVTVKNSAVRTSGISGGIAGEISRTVIENSNCNNVIINAFGGQEIIYAGGVAGTAADSVIVDCEVSTGSGKTARIQGTGYIGGIVGYQNSCDIYNVKVSGVIGGEGSTAIGGITGEYASGKMKVARFEGSLGISHLGQAAREGIFIGTRRGAASNYNYIDDLAYLFADSESKISEGVCGSEISDDNDYTYAAHIGYWHSDDLFFTLMQGGTSRDEDSRYFYEELEQGILSIMDEEQEGGFTIDHFAPNAVGRPVRGYLVIANQIDTVANGRDFYDVASLTVRGSSRYSKEIDKDNRGAVAPGEVVSVSTAPRNTDSEKYQMEGTPFYINRAGTKRETSYSDSVHCYTFQMPAENISVSATYKKVAADVKIEPETYKFTVTQMRTGNRKSPVKTTEIKNRDGKLIASYINGILEQGTKAQPVYIAAFVDTNNDVSDSRVRWSVDDAELIHLAKNDDEGSDGYTNKTAEIMVNLDASFFTGIVAELEQRQANENYLHKIPDTIYGAGYQNGGVAVLTAKTRPSNSFEGKPCTANCRIAVTFQILDRTLVAAEDAVLDKQALEFTVKRTLSGDRTAPDENITVTPPQSVTASFEPDHFSKNEVVWTTSDPAVISVSQDPAAFKEASISAVKDSKWIRDLIAADDGIRQNDRYSRINGSGNRSAVVAVDAKDMLGNHKTAECSVNVKFVTSDETSIVPEKLVLDKMDLNFNLIIRKRGDSNSDTVEASGFDGQRITANVLPDVSDIGIHQPYDREIQWFSQDSTAVTVDSDGNVSVVPNAPWIQAAMKRPPYRSDKNVDIIAKTKTGECTAKCTVHLSFQLECLEADRGVLDFHVDFTKTGRRSAPVWKLAGQEPVAVGADIYIADPASREIVWKTGTPEIVTVDREGNVSPVMPVLRENGQYDVPAWIKEIMEKYPYQGFVSGSVKAVSADGGMEDTVQVRVNFRMMDETYGGGSSGGSSGGGSKSAGGSTGITPAGKTMGPGGTSGAVTGTWTQMANGKWVFAAGRTYAGEWAYIDNPYALGDQSKAAWFRFDEEGFLMTGWYLDEAGNLFYLNPLQDGTMGQMAVGWQKLTDGWYYFNPVSDGTMGKLLTDTVIDGIYTVGKDGRWIEQAGDR